ncbi:MAG: DUF1674 domain-containing protein [Alphaproteobacteria bacterium]|nr:DUF1674 domain-containing protein [Alphaproteobacteria bacterium]
MSRFETPDTPVSFSTADSAQDGAGRDLPPAAKRALAEAEARRAARDAEANKAPTEIGGVKGPDPARYGDWEKDGIVSDF